MLTYRVVTGIGEGMQNVALAAALGAFYYQDRALALGLLQCSLGIGSFIGPLLGAWLVSDLGDWRLPFYVFGVLGLIGAVGMTFVSKGFTEQRPQTVKHVVSEDHLPVGIWNRNVLCIMVTGVVRAIVFYGFLALYATFLLQKLHFDFTTASLALSMFGLGPFLGPITGHISDRTNPKTVQIAAMAAMAVIGFLIFNVVTSPIMQIILAFLEGAASGVMFVNGYSLAQRSVRSPLIGRVSGIYYASTMMPAGISGWLLAQFADRFGWQVGGTLMMSYVFVVPILVALLIETSRMTGKVVKLPLVLAKSP